MLRLVCPRCDAALAPTISGLRCPRLNACGRGGIVESGPMLHPLVDPARSPTGVRA